MELSHVEVRVVGALTEKGATTPDHYPLSTQALVAACNQRQSRSPVTDLTEDEIVVAIQSLRGEGLVRSIKRTGDRVMKHRHDLDRVLGLTAEGVAVLSVLLLRGPQTPGELRQRTERYVTFPSLHDVEVVLEALADRDEPLVRSLGRRPGQKEDRWTQLLGAGGPESASATSGRNESSEERSPDSTLGAKVDALALEVATLRRELDALRSDLGNELDG